VKAALSDTEIPTVIVRPADEGKVLIDMPDEASSWRMDVSRFIPANSMFIMCNVLNLVEFLLW
jgi:hypothetical protein